MAWEKGQSGNPAGGKIGARRKLAESFLQTLQEDWKEHGAKTVVEMREKDPVAYVKCVAALLPQQVEHEVGEGLAALLSGISDRESAGAVSPVEDTGTGAVCH